MGPTDAPAAILERNDLLLPEPEEIDDLPRQPPGLDLDLGGDRLVAPFTHPACGPFLFALLLEQARQLHRPAAKELSLQAQSRHKLINDVAGGGRKTRIEDELIDGNGNVIRCLDEVSGGLSRQDVPGRADMDGVQPARRKTLATGNLLA